MSWSNEDSILASCGTEGAVYGWDIIRSTRIYETVIKANPFSGVAINREGRNIFAVGIDGHVRELFNSNIHRDVIIGSGTQLDGIVMSALDTMLFVSGQSGFINCLRSLGFSPTIALTIKSLFIQGAR